jgi:hypothetical protein
MKTESRVPKWLIVLLLGCVLFFPQVDCLGRGTLIAQHSGANDPTTEGFLGGVKYGDPVTRALTNDFGVNAWATSIDNSGFYYDRWLGSLSGQDWTFGTTLRVVSPGVKPGAFTIAAWTGTTAFNMLIGSDSSGNPIFSVSSFTNGSVAYASVVLIGGGSTYNAFQLNYHAASSTADLWVNGTERLSGLLATPFAAPAFLEWGGGYQGAVDYQVNWASVSLEIIPEPSGVSLVIAGALLFAAGRLLRPRPFDEPRSACDEGFGQAHSLHRPRAAWCSLGCRPRLI